MILKSLVRMNGKVATWNLYSVFWSSGQKLDFFGRNFGTFFDPDPETEGFIRIRKLNTA